MVDATKSFLVLCQALQKSSKIQHDLLVCAAQFEFQIEDKSDS